jgi:hypothetical protein
MTFVIIHSIVSNSIRMHGASARRRVNDVMSVFGAKPSCAIGERTCIVAHPWVKTADCVRWWNNKDKADATRLIVAIFVVAARIVVVNTS